MAALKSQHLGFRFYLHVASVKAPMTFYFHNQGQKLADDSRGYRLSGPLAKGVSQNPDRLQEKKVNDINTVKARA